MFQMSQISNVYISNDQKLKSFKCVICRSLKTNLSVIRLPHNIRLPHCVTATSHTSTKCNYFRTYYTILYMHTCTCTRASKVFIWEQIQQRRNIWRSASNISYTKNLTLTGRTARTFLLDVKICYVDICY